MSLKRHSPKRYLLPYEYEMNHLIRKITNVMYDDERFGSFQDKVVPIFRSSRSPPYDIESEYVTRRSVKGLAEKFFIKGFYNASTDLLDLFDRFVDSGCRSSVHHKAVRVAIIKLLLSLSDSPITFMNLTAGFKRKHYEAELIDWNKHLRVGGDMIRLNFQSDSDDELVNDVTDTPESMMIRSYGSKKRFSVSYKEDVSFNEEPKWRALKKYDRHDSLYQTSLCWDYLYSQCQNVWWDNIIHDSEMFRRSKKMTRKRIKTGEYKEHPVVVREILALSEYQVLRELIFEFFGLFTGASMIQYSGKLIPRLTLQAGDYKTISFTHLVSEFCIIINIYHELQTAIDNMELMNKKKRISLTYCAYIEGLKNTLRSHSRAICYLEKAIKNEAKTFSIQKLWSLFKPLKKNIEIIYTIHRRVLLDQEMHCVRAVALFLIVELFNIMKYAECHEESAISTALFIFTIEPYLNMIESWCTRGEFDDPFNEFIIETLDDEVTRVDCSSCIDYIVYYMEHTLRPEPGKISGKSIHTIFEEHWALKYYIRIKEPMIIENPFINYIVEDVFYTGKTVHILRVVHKEHDPKYKTPLVTLNFAKEFLRSYINELGKMENPDYVTALPSCGKEKGRMDLSSEMSIDAGSNTPSEGMFVIYSEVLESKLLPLFQSEIFVQPYREEFYYDAPSLASKIYNMSQGVMCVTKPLLDIFENFMVRQHEQVGEIVKEVFCDQFGLLTHFSFLKYLFLFENDGIKNFYKSIFKRLDLGQDLNALHLTQILQNCLMDKFPESYDTIFVKINPFYKQCFSPLEIFDLIKVNYMHSYPLTVVINSEHISQYQDVFSQMLKLKWCMSTLNQTMFFDREGISFGTDMDEAHRKQRNCLHRLRFIILDSVVFLFHFYHGYLFVKAQEEFEINFNSTNHIEALIGAHDYYIRLLSLYTFQGYKRLNIYEFIDKILHGVVDVLRFWKGNQLVDKLILEKMFERFTWYKRVMEMVLNPLMQCKVVPFNPIEEIKKEYDPTKLGKF